MLFVFHLQLDKPGTPVSKSATPTSSGNVTPGPSGAMKAVAKPPLGEFLCGCVGELMYNPASTMLQ